MILFKIAPNGLIWEKRLAIHHRWLFTIELMKHWVPSNVAVKFKYRSTSVTNMLTELSIRRSGCFAIFMGWMLLMVLIHAVPLVSISHNVLLSTCTSLVKTSPTTNTFLQLLFGDLLLSEVLQRFFLRGIFQLPNWLRLVLHCIFRHLVTVRPLCSLSLSKCSPSFLRGSL